MNAAPEPVPVSDDTPAATPLPDDAGLWRRRRWLRICVRVFLALIVLGGGVKLCFWHALRSELADLYASGGPVTWDEVCDSIEPIPDEENSALVLLPVLESFRDWGRDEHEFAVRWSSDDGARPSDEMQRRMRVVMSEGSAVLDILHEAAEHPRGRWPIEQDRGPMWHNPESYALRNIRPLLQLEATLRAVEGDAEKAARTVRTILRTGASMDEAPYLKCQRWRLGFAEDAADSLEQALTLLAMSTGDLAILRKAFAAEADQMSLRTAFLGERATFLGYVTDYGFSDREYYGLLHKVLYFVPGLVEADMLYGLECLKKEMALLDLSPREQVKQARALFEARQAKIKTMGGCPCPDSRSLRNWRIVSIDLCPELARTLLIVLGIKQRLHLARAALAVEQFRVEHDRWPAKLAELVPDYLDAVPQDWYGSAGSTVSYMQTPTGVRLWSVKQWNAKNDAGLTGQERSDLWYLAHDIREFIKAKGRTPISLSELVPDVREPIPIDGRTGKPFSYEPGASGSESFVLGGFADGMAEGEYWKHRLATEDWADLYHPSFEPTMFRLLNPELRGARQMSFPEEFPNPGGGLRDLGYTPDHLRKRGYSEEVVKEYIDDIEYEKELAESRREWKAQKDRQERRRLGLPDLPADSEGEPVP
jgi:hypothetical protein